VVSYRLWRGFSKKVVERGDWMSCNLTTEIELLGRSRHELVGNPKYGPPAQAHEDKSKGCPELLASDRAYGYKLHDSLSSRTSEKKMWATDFIIIPLNSYELRWLTLSLPQLLLL
jgi:hypothetical protein